MAAKKKFKRDYIILEAKDANFRYKERVLPKAFAKVEVNEDKSVVALYLENIKYMKEGYRVVVIQSDYETVDLGKVVVNEQGKGDFVLDLVNDEVEIKGIAILYDKSVPLIGFKGNKIDNYEEILFTGDNDEYEYIEVDDDEEYEYIEVEDSDDEYEYIEVDDNGEDDSTDDTEEYEYEEIEYIEIDDDSDDDYDNNGVDDADEYEYEEIEYIEIEDDYDDYKEINNDDDFINPRTKKQQPQQRPQQKSQQKPQPQKQVFKQPQKQQHRQQVKQSDTQPYVDSNNKPASTFLMPRQIKKGLKYFREVKPFVCDYVEDTRWWKIEINPTTLCGYTMPYLGYVNALNYTMYSDAIMNSYKYRHYLFGVQYDEYNKRKNYIYAIPGRREEQPDRGQTGFSVYQACDNRNDSLGYWLCFIDPKSRRILK